MRDISSEEQGDFLSANQTETCPVATDELLKCRKPGGRRREVSYGSGWKQGFHNGSLRAPGSLLIILKICGNVTKVLAGCDTPCHQPNPKSCEMFSVQELFRIHLSGLERVPGKNPGG